MAGRGDVKTTILFFALDCCCYLLIVHCGFDAMQRNPKEADPAAWCLHTNSGQDGCPGSKWCARCVWPCSTARITAAGGGSADVGCVSTPLCRAVMLTAYMALLSQLISCRIPAVLSGGEADRQPVCGLKPADQRSVFLVL